VELHGGYFMLHEDGEQGGHLVLAVPERDFVNGTAAHILQSLLERLATGIRDEKHLVEAGTPKNI